MQKGVSMKVPGTHQHDCKVHPVSIYFTFYQTTNQKYMLTYLKYDRNNELKNKSVFAFLVCVSVLFQKREEIQFTPW